MSFSGRTGRIPMGARVQYLVLRPYGAVYRLFTRAVSTLYVIDTREKPSSVHERSISFRAAWGNIPMGARVQYLVVMPHGKDYTRRERRQGKGPVCPR